ncbi:MAG: BrnT family toxin [Salinarimonas sp.]
MHSTQDRIFFAYLRLVAVDGAARYTSRVPPPLRFEWDDAKAASNEAKHGVSFKQATLVFLDPTRVNRRDGRRDYGEIRLVTIGRGGNALLFVCYTARRHQPADLRAAREPR